jgi:hypothetical protein
MSDSFRASRDVIIRTARQALLSAGCAIVEEDASVPRCYFRDPYGLVFNIEQ